MRRALAVGIDQYPGSPLIGCVDDAKKIGDVLSKNEDGSPNFDCRLLLAPPDTVHKAHLFEAVEELFGQKADIAVLYFSGHGTANNLAGYLVTQDVRKYNEGLDMTYVLNMANNAPIDEVLIILDCCDSGAFGKVPAVNNYATILREGVSVLTSSRSGQPSVATSTGSVFTNLVCAGMDGGASDVLGKVTAASLYAYVDQSLSAWDQRPLYMAHVSRLSTIRQCKPVIDVAILRKLPTLFASSDVDFRLDPTYERTSGSSTPQHEATFRELQRLRDARLLEPVDADHMYDAAMNSKSCRLTALGRFYWSLAQSNKI